MLPSIPVGGEIAVAKIDRAPRRGTVVVFRAPERPDTEYVKRVIGVGGDTIATNGTEVLVNGSPIPRCHLGAWSYEEADGRAHAGEIWLEALEGSTWLVFHDTAGLKAPPPGPWTVAPGEVFVLADNRENGHDSRLWFGGKGGGVPLRLIVGAASAVGVPSLPKGAESLAPALDACVAALSKPS
jgi:signal peptidase I